MTLKHRVVLSAQFDKTDMNKFGQVVGSILAPFPGVSAVQFFVNAVDTTTNSADVVVDYSYRLLTATAAANFTKTAVDDVRVPLRMQERFSSVTGGADRMKQLFLGRYSRNLLEDLLPHQKGTLGLRRPATPG